MSVACVQQVISALKIMRGEDGTKLGETKLKQLREHSNMFRNRLRAMGCHVLGEEDSPVIPLMLYHPVKITAFSRLALQDNVRLKRPNSFLGLILCFYFADRCCCCWIPCHSSAAITCPILHVCFPHNRFP